jgi:hypothetical protein
MLCTHTPSPSSFVRVLRLHKPLREGTRGTTGLGEPRAVWEASASHPHGLVGTASHPLPSPPLLFSHPLMGSRPSRRSLSLSLSLSLSERRRQRSVWRGKAAVARPCRRGKSRRVADTEVFSSFPSFPSLSVSCPPISQPLHMEVGCRLPAVEALGRG